MNSVASSGFGKIRIHPLSIILAQLLLAGAVNAQISKTVTDGHVPPGVAPGNPTASYPVSGIDNINLFNGNVNLSIPLAVIGGRGNAGYAMTLRVESYKWRVRENLQVQMWDPGNEFPPEYYWETYWRAPEFNFHHSAGYTPGKLVGVWAVDTPPPTGFSCQNTIYTSQVLTRLQFYAPDGSMVELYDKKNQGNAASYNFCTWSGGYNRGRVFVTADGESMTFISDSDISDNPNNGTHHEFAPTGYLLFRDGTRYRIVSGAVTWIRDRNGNQARLE